jgi:ABC-type multidrug transport system ATPase subunit
MNIKLQKAGKRYQKTWVFRNIDLVLQAKEYLAVLGPNGSGKSTFLKMLSGALLPNEGKVLFEINNKEIVPNNLYKYISIAAPYIEIIEELNVKEMFSFHKRLKPFTKGLSIESIIARAKLHEHKSKKISELSSGLKQRVKLALAIFSETPLLLLDEPVTNLDKDGIEWYNNLINEQSGDRIIVICSNHNEAEYSFCERKLNMETFLTTPESFL